jgi:hypothetical protein
MSLERNQYSSKEIRIEIPSLFLKRASMLGTQLIKRVIQIKMSLKEDLSMKEKYS